MRELIHEIGNRVGFLDWGGGSWSSHVLEEILGSRGVTRGGVAVGGWLVDGGAGVAVCWPMLCFSPCWV